MWNYLEQSVGHQACATPTVSQRPQCGSASVETLKGRRNLNEQAGWALAVAAHDLRSPLSAVASIATILLEEPDLGVSERREFLETILRTCANTQQLLTRLLDFSRLELGHLDLCLRSVEIRPFVTSVTQLAQPICERKGIGLTAAVNCERQDYLFDPDLIAQVLTNLIGNAAKFSHASTSVRLEVSDSPDLRFEVVDEGLGIRADEMPRLFREFQQTSTRATGGEPGSGLGLAICQRLVRLHGGQIGAESAPGQGSRFWFTVPAATA